MLYLIRTFGRSKKQTSLKVGFSDNLKERFSSYKNHNPFFEVISSREGSRYEETKLHLYLTALGYKENFLEEWFLDCSEVLSKFHENFNKIDRTIWLNRDTLFSKSDFKDKKLNLKRQIYEELRMIHKIEHPKQIDKDWKIESNQKILKRLRTNSEFLD